MSAKREVDTTLARGVVGGALSKLPTPLRQRMKFEQRQAYDRHLTEAVIHSLDADTLYALALREMNAASALKYLLITAVYSTDALRKAADYDGPHVGWKLENADEVVDAALKDAPSWAACRPFIVIDAVHPGWLAAKLDSMATKLRISAIVAQPPIVSTYAATALRNTYGSEFTSARVVPKGADYDDISAIGMETPDDTFVYVAPYVFSKTPGRRTLDVTVFALMSISDSRGARKDTDIVNALKAKGYLQISDLMSMGEVAILTEVKNLPYITDMADEISHVAGAADKILSGEYETLRKPNAGVFFNMLNAPSELAKPETKAIALLVGVSMARKVKLPDIVARVNFAELLLQVDHDKLFADNGHAISDLANSVKHYSPIIPYNYKHYLTIVTRAISEQKKRDRKYADYTDRLPALIDLQRALR